jgi:hypothetical protein
MTRVCVCVCVSGDISFNFRNILIYGQNPLSRISSFNFLSVASATQLDIEQSDVTRVTVNCFC